MPIDHNSVSTVPPVKLTTAVPAFSADAVRCLHCDPPLTPAGFFARRRRLLAGLGVLFVLLAVAGFVNGGSLLLTWDEPIQRAVEAARTPDADELFRRISFLGSTPVVLVLGCVLVTAAWRRCRAVGIVVLVAMLSRPLLEFNRRRHESVRYVAHTADLRHPAGELEAPGSE